MTFKSHLFSCMPAPGGYNKANKNMPVHITIVEDDEDIAALDEMEGEKYGNDNENSDC